MNGKPFVSVIVPSYNVEDYIEQCVESIIAQTYCDWELILVDDGSTDRTGEVCDNYAKKDDRIKVVHKPNGGLVSARKRGLEEAVGEYVFYVDGDDWITTNAIEILCTCAKEENADIVIADYIYSKTNSQEMLSQNMRAGIYKKEDLQKEFYPRMLWNGEYYLFGIYPALHGKIIRKNILNHHQKEVDDRIRLGEDAACSYGCYLEAETLFYLKEKYIYYYRVRQTSISHNIRKSLYTQETEILIEHLRNQFLKYARKAETPDVIEILEPQLCMYTCYMIDNMLTAYISFSNLFFGKELRDTLRYIRESEMGQKMLQYCSTVRTCSRTKRLLKVIERPNIITKMDFILFRTYEKCGKLNRIMRGNG